MSFLRGPELKEVPAPQPVPERPRVACQWCGREGTWLEDIEAVVTAGGTRQRCVDREYCRIRAGELHRHRQEAA